MLIGLAIVHWIGCINAIKLQIKKKREDWICSMSDVNEIEDKLFFTV